MSKLLLANLAAAAAALSAGAAVVATRVAVAETDPATLALVRYLIALACILPFLPLLRPNGPLPAADVVRIAFLGALFYGFFPWAFSAALQHTTAARGAIGLATIPIQTLIIAVLAGRERAGVATVVSVGLAFGGIATVFGPQALAVDGADHLRGDALMLLGAFSAALYSVFGRPVLGRHGPMFVTMAAMAAGVVALAPVSLVAGGPAELPALSRQAWIALLFLGSVAGAVQFSLFAWALRWLPPTRTVLYLTLNPITAMVLGAAMLGEPVDARLIAGLVLVLAGILAANLPRLGHGAALREPQPIVPPVPLGGR